MIGLALGACAALATAPGGCASSKRTDTAATGGGSDVRLAAWSPATDARFVTIQRDTVMTLVDGDGDMFVLTTEGHQRGGGSPYHTWIVRLDREARPYEVITVGLGASAWLATNDQSGNRRVTPARGALTIHEQIDGVMHAGVSLSCDEAPMPTPAVFYDGAWERIARRPVVETAPLTTRSGLPHRARPERPERSPAIAVWPWEEIFAGYSEKDVATPRQ